MSILGFEKPDRLCIVDPNGVIVKLNDQSKTELRFDASERLRARKILGRLNHGPYKGKDAPRYRMIPLIEQGA